MKITFPEYIKNPMGNRVMSNFQLYYRDYSVRLDKLLLRENGKINYFLFKDEKNGRYIVYIKIPSEKCKGFYYDAVIEFRPSGDKSLASESIKDYYVRFYSNDPSFVFNHCYSFIQNDIFFTDLETKMSKLARTQKATVTNKKNDVGYVKSLFFAYLIMELKGLFSKKVFDYNGRKYSQVMLLNMIEHSNTKFANRQQVEKDQKQDQAKYDKLERVNPLSAMKNAKSSTATHTTSSRFAKKVSTIKKVKKI